MKLRIVNFLNVKLRVHKAYANESRSRDPGRSTVRRLCRKALKL
jgi:hypothetical protein